MNKIDIRYKTGDITPNGFEVIELRLKPVYKMRKRITIKKNVFNKKYAGKKGWVYTDSEFGITWYELDKFPGQMLRFRDIECTY